MTIESNAVSSDETGGVLVVGSTNRFDGLMMALDRDYGVRATVVGAEDIHEHLGGIDCIVGGPELLANDDPSAIERIRATRPDLPIVFVYEDRETAADALAAGVDHCIRHDGRPPSERAGHVAAVVRGERRNEGSDPAGIDEAAFVRSALDALDDVFFVFDLDGEFVEWNTTLTEVTGYTHEEIAAMTPTDFVAADDAEAVAAAIDRAVSDGRATVEADLRTKSGDRIPHEFTGSLLETDAGETLGICGVGRDVTERNRQKRYLERYETVVEAAPVGVFVLDEMATILGANEAAWSMVGHTAAELVGEPFSTLIEEGVVEGDVVEKYIETLRELLSSETETEIGELEVEITPSDGERRTYQVYLSVLPFDEEFRGTVGVFQDITERKTHIRALEEQAERLRVTNRVNEIIRDVNQALVRASTREAIQKAVCANLAGGDAYRFAWIGDRGAVGEGVQARAWAGIENGYLDNRPTVEDAGEGVITAATAIETGEMQVAQSVADDPAFEPWREAALARGYESAAAIPLVYRGTTHGVLCVYSPRPNAFEETEREVLRELGETIGYAFSAVERRRALVSDTVLELEFALGDRSVFTVDLTARTGCRVTLDGVIERADGSLVEFVTVTGTDPETVLDLASEHDGIDVELLSRRENDAEAVFRLVSAGSSSTVSLADQGGVIREGVAENGEGRLVFELPQDADVRAIVTAITERYADTELVAQREHERTSTRGAEFRAALDEALTDRQGTVLKTAYLSGFFEWPRPMAGDAIADSLDISGPTFHEHIRTSQRKLLESYFDTETASKSTRNVEGT